MTRYIYSAISEDTAVYANDYPWGYKLRTKQRYWIESTKHGQRLVAQTINPKTGKWCKPKKTTYSDVMVITQDDNPDSDTFEHYSRTSLSMYSETEEIIEFIEKHKEGFSEFQKDQANYLLACKKVGDEIWGKVGFTINASKIGPVSLSDRSPANLAKLDAISKEQEERKEKQREYSKAIMGKLESEFRALNG